MLLYKLQSKEKPTQGSFQALSKLMRSIEPLLSDN